MRWCAFPLSEDFVAPFYGAKSMRPSASNKQIRERNEDSGDMIKQGVSAGISAHCQWWLWLLLFLLLLPAAAFTVMVVVVLSMSVWML